MANLEVKDMKPRYGPVITMLLLCAVALGLGFAVANLDPPAAPQEVAAVDDSIDSGIDNECASTHNDDGDGTISQNAGTLVGNEQYTYRDDGVFIRHSGRDSGPGDQPNPGLQPPILDYAAFHSHTFYNAGGRFAGADC